MAIDPTYPLVAAMVVSLIIYQLNQRRASPALAIINRWLRWIIFSIGIAKIATDFGWSSRPFWVLAVTAALGHFFIETIYRWLEIKALSLSPIPLFPKFAINSSGEEWPTDARLLRTRDWLRQQEFKLVQSLKAEVAPTIYLRSSIYEDSTHTLRLQILFLPQVHGGITMCFNLATLSSDGCRYVTDNLHLPFGGFYPENWLLERRPWLRSLPKLVARHRQRLAVAGVTAEAWSEEPLADINAQQHGMERLNTELGFLFPHADREEFGKMTDEGRFRLWKEVWSLNYFGRSARYD